MAGVEVASAYVSLIPSFRGAQGAIAGELGPIGDKGGKAAGKGFRGGLLASIKGIAGPLLATVGVAALTRGIFSSIQQASGVVEAGTAIKAVFGEAAGEIERFSSRGAKALGLSRLETLKSAQTFGIFGKAAGLGGPALSDFSNKLTTLSVDFASFYDATPEEAVQAIGAGLRGESEPLRRFGILLDDATLKARAMALGIYEGTGPLTQQQRVLAAQAEILQQGAVASGDYQKTQGGLANQQRELRANVADLSGSFGKLLLPAMTAIVAFLNNSILPALTRFIDFLGGGGMAGAGAGFMAIIRPIGDFLSSVFGPVFEQLGPVFAALVPQIMTLISSFSPLGLILKAITPILPQLAAVFSELAVTVGGVLATALQSLVTALAPVIEALVGGLSMALSTILPILAEVAITVAGVFGQALASILPALMTVAQVVGQVLAVALQAIAPLIAMVAEFIGELFVAVSPLIGAIFGLVGAIIPLLAPIGQLVGGLLQGMIGFLSILLKPILALIWPLIGGLAGALAVVVTAISTVIGWIVKGITWFVNLVSQSNATSGGIRGIWSGIANFFSTIWNNIVNFFRGGIDRAVNFVQGLPGRIMGAVGNLANLLYSAGRDLIQGLIRGVQDMVGRAVQAAKDVGKNIMNGVKNFLGISSPSRRSRREIGREWGAGIVLGIRDQFSAVVAAADDLAALMDINAATSSLNGLSKVGLVDSTSLVLADASPTFVFEGDSAAFMEWMNVWEVTADGRRRRIITNGKKR